MRRVPVIATLLLFIVALTACGGGPGTTTTTIPTLGLGISLHDAKQFFNHQGGGDWKLGEYTGGEVGYAAGNASGHFCPTQLNGRTIDLNHIYVACLNEAGVGTRATPEEAAAVVEATIHRVVPGATEWARKTLASSGSSSSSDGSIRTKISGPTYLSITQGGEGMVLVIEPEINAAGQRLPGTPGATSTTSTTS
jgi:hypothetical protein